LAAGALVTHPYGRAAALKAQASVSARTTKRLMTRI